MSSFRTGNLRRISALLPRDANVALVKGTLSSGIESRPLRTDDHATILAGLTPQETDVLIAIGKRIYATRFIEKGDTDWYVSWQDFVELAMITVKLNELAVVGLRIFDYTLTPGEEKKLQWFIQPNDWMRDITAGAAEQPDLSVNVSQISSAIPGTLKASDLAKVHEYLLLRHRQLAGPPLAEDFLQRIVFVSNLDYPTDNAFPPEDTASAGMNNFAQLQMGDQDAGAVLPFFTPILTHANIGVWRPIPRNDMEIRVELQGAQLNPPNLPFRVNLILKNISGSTYNINGVVPVVFPSAEFGFINFRNLLKTAEYAQLLAGYELHFTTQQPTTIATAQGYHRLLLALHNEGYQNFLIMTATGFQYTLDSFLNLVTTALPAGSWLMATPGSTRFHIVFSSWSGTPPANVSPEADDFREIVAQTLPPSTVFDGATIITAGQIFGYPLRTVGTAGTLGGSTTVNWTP